MLRHNAWSRGRRRVAAGLVAVLSLAAPAVVEVAAPEPAGAEPLTGSLVLNPGGGMSPDGADGLRTRVMAAGSATVDGHAARGEGQWCCGFPDAPSGRLMLVVGTVLIGPGGLGWTSVELMAADGTTTTTGGTDVGSASATIRYTATAGGLDYVVDRTLSYVHPNDFVTDVFRVTIPEGSTEPVKLYYWGDTAPGGSDVGYGVLLTEPRRSIISLNTTSRVMFGFREVPGTLPFTGARSETLGQSGVLYNLAREGGSIGFAAQAANHDAMLWVEWDLGTAPGTRTAGMEVFATPQGATLTGSFRDATTTTADGTMLDLQIVNTNLAPADDLAFTFDLPAGLVATGTGTSSCGGTVDVGPGGSSVALAGGAVAATSNCVISVPVAASTPGTFTISSASVRATSTGLDNGVGSVGLEVAGPPLPPAPEPEPEPDEPVAGPGLDAPARLLDTRTTGDPLAAGEERAVVVASRGGVPDDAMAAVLTATVVDPAADGHLTVHPCGERPPTSTTNFAAGQTVANAATIGLDASGRACVTSTVATHLVVDVTAAHRPVGTAGLVPLAPSRLVDTRLGAGPVAAGDVLAVPVAGLAGVPDDATSVVLDVVVTEPGGPGHATVFPCGPTLPATSSLNYVAGQTVAAGVVSAIGAGGAVCVKTSATGHVVVDVQAAYGPTGRSVLVPLPPDRLVDVRPDRLAAGSTLALDLRDEAGGVPAGATAVVLNVTATDASAPGHVTVAPCGDVPLVSNLNVEAGRTVANAATVAVGDDGRVCLTTTTSTALVVDVTGAYVA